MAFLIIIGILYVIAMLFLFFAGPAIRRALHQEVHYIKNKGSQWLKDPDYYRNKRR